MKLCFIMLPLALVGCATATVEIASQGEAPTEALVPAVAVDLITLPVQAVVLPFLFAKDSYEKRQKERLTSIVAKLRNNSEFSENYLRDHLLEQDEIAFFLSPENRDVLDKDDLVLIWNEYKFGYGAYISRWVIEHPLTPASVLRERYHTKTKHRGMKGLNLSYSLLAHPNLPDDLIKEIQEDALQYIQDILARNPKLKK